MSFGNRLKITQEKKKKKYAESKEEWSSPSSYTPTTTTWSEQKSIRSTSSRIKKQHTPETMDGESEMTLSTNSLSGIPEKSLDQKALHNKFRTVGATMLISVAVFAAVSVVLSIFWITTIAIDTTAYIPEARYLQQHIGKSLLLKHFLQPVILTDTLTQIIETHYNKSTMLPLEEVKPIMTKFLEKNHQLVSDGGEVIIKTPQAIAMLATLPNTLLTCEIETPDYYLEKKTNCEINFPYMYIERNYSKEEQIRVYGVRTMEPYDQTNEIKLLFKDVISNRYENDKRGDFGRPVNVNCYKSATCSAQLPYYGKSMTGKGGELGYIIATLNIEKLYQTLEKLQIYKPRVLAWERKEGALFYDSNIKVKEIVNKDMGSDEYHVELQEHLQHMYGAEFERMNRTIHQSTTKLHAQVVYVDVTKILSDNHEIMIAIVITEWSINQLIFISGISLVFVSLIFFIVSLCHGLVVSHLIGAPIKELVNNLRVLREGFQIDSINLSSRPFISEIDQLQYQFCDVLQQLSLYRSFLPQHILKTKSKPRPKPLGEPTNEHFMKSQNKLKEFLVREQKVTPRLDLGLRACQATFLSVRINFAEDKSVNMNMLTLTNIMNTIIKVAKIRNGYIEHFDDNHILLGYNAAVTCLDHVEMAIESAILMLQQISYFPSFSKSTSAGFCCAIGISTGEVWTGTIGGVHKRMCRSIGSAVSFAEIASQRAIDLSLSCVIDSHTQREISTLNKFGVRGIDLIYLNISEFTFLYELKTTMTDLSSFEAPSSPVSSPPTSIFSKSFSKSFSKRNNRVSPSPNTIPHHQHVPWKPTKNWATSYRLGWAHLMKSQFSSAEKHFTDFLSLHDNEPLTLQLLGLVRFLKQSDLPWHAYVESLINDYVLLQHPGQLFFSVIHFKTFTIKDIDSSSKKEEKAFFSPKPKNSDSIRPSESSLSLRSDDLSGSRALGLSFSTMSSTSSVSSSY